MVSHSDAFLLGREFGKKREIQRISLPTLMEKEGGEKIRMQGVDGDQRELFSEQCERIYSERQEKNRDELLNMKQLRMYANDGRDKETERQKQRHTERKVSVRISGLTVTKKVSSKKRNFYQI